MADFLSSETAVELAEQKWFESLSSTILITGINSFKSALNEKTDYAGALAALDHASTILHHLYMAQWQFDQDWDFPEIVVEFREKMDKKELVGVTDSDGNFGLPAIWIHLGHGGYDYPFTDAQITLGYEGDGDWIDTKEILDFIEQCKMGHILLAVLPICKSKYSKEVLSESNKISLIIGDDEEDINPPKVEEYLNSLRDLCSDSHRVFRDCMIHAAKKYSNAGDN